MCMVEAVSWIQGMMIMSMLVQVTSTANENDVVAQAGIRLLPSGGQRAEDCA
jgi:hypothetical protein